MQWPHDYLEIACITPFIDHSTLSSICFTKHYCFCNVEDFVESRRRNMSKGSNITRNGGAMKGGSNSLRLIDHTLCNEKIMK